MAYLFADRVQVTATATTTAPFALGSAVTGFQSFAFLTTTGNTTYYTASDTAGNWEVGIGTYNTTGPTLSRTLLSSSTGSLISFPGTINVFCTYPSERAVLTDFAQTLTNKRVNPRISTAATTVTPNADTDDQFNATALSGTATIALPTGTPADGQKLTLRLTAAATTTLTWNTVYVGRGIILPTTLSTFSYVGCVWNASTSKWDVIALTGPG
jgi:hypothetical protein